MQRNVLDRLAKWIRYLTPAPLIALLLLVGLALARPGLLGSPLYLGLALVFLVALPLLGYPLQPLFPCFRDRGREGQRDLAIVFANIGYALGVVVSLLSRASRPLMVIFLTYGLTGLLILVFNKLVPIRASGHGAGVTGPILLGLVYVGPWALLGLVLLVAIYWASLRMKRHTWPQLLSGSLLPAVALGLSFLATAPLY